MTRTNWKSRWITTLALAAVATVAAASIASAAPARLQPGAAGAQLGFEGKLSLDDGLVKLKIARVLSPSAGGQQSLLLLGRKALLEVGLNVDIRDARGARVPFPLIDDVIARVNGRLLPARAWRWDGDDLRPVIAATRIVVLQFELD